MIEGVGRHQKEGFCENITLVRFPKIITAETAKEAKLQLFIGHYTAVAASWKTVCLIMSFYKARN